ncbi:hypothetical protein BASA81_017668 [Batrachochytrium salamandrivorans]|nr:hypothetical protein BASA81_017668 [Batrachochytrium salamandrivorans]
MIVGIGAILSVLSSSVLAAVIPDYDSHGILLVRRAVNPENHAVLWKRNNEEQTGPGPSNPGAGNGDGAGTSNGQNVINELERVTNSASDTSAMLKSLHADYTDLILKVGRKNNEGHIKVTDTYRSSLKGYYSGPWKSFHSIVGLLKNGKLKFKGNNPSIFDAHKTRVQKRLGLKSLSSTGRVLSPEETGQQILKPRPPVQQISQQDTSYQGPPNQGTSNQGPPDKDTSKQGPSDEDTSDQDESDPIPAKRRRMMISQETRV